MHRMMSLLSLGCGMVLCAQVYAGQVENPQYKDWARFKPGTSTTMAMTSDMGGQSSKSETRTTLKEVNDDKLVVETVTSMEAAGQKMDMPAQSMEIKKMMDEMPAAPPAAQPPADAPKADVKTSEESVTVGGGTFKAKVAETSMDVAGSKTTSKTWTSEEVPGGIVKMESTMDGAMKGTTKMELTKFDKK
jgi:hypothetical protein